MNQIILLKKSWNNLVEMGAQKVQISILSGPMQRQWSYSFKPD
jgi:hypothetical protein